MYYFNNATNIRQFLVIKISNDIFFKVKQKSGMFISVFIGVSLK